MRDPRVDNLARVLVRYSLAVRSRQHVAVDATPEAQPLVEAVYAELLRAGAYPVVRMSPASLSEIFYRLGKAHHFDRVTRYQRAFAELMDATLRIASSPNTRALTSTDPRKMARVSRATRPLREILLKKPWVVTLFPTQAYAQDAEMSLAEFENFVYHATFADEKDPVACWKEQARRQARIVAALRGADHIRIVGPETDLEFSVKGRYFVNSAGRHNMPCGEIFTGPIENSAEGYIRYDYPVCHGGREIDGIRLVFRRGRVVEASAEKNEAYLKTMLRMDAGATRLGEFGIGTNYRVDRFIKNILFDEKIGGTVHLALGQSYEETRGRNRSALHWDMIKDLRRGGIIYVDGKVLQKDGRFRV